MLAITLTSCALLIPTSSLAWREVTVPDPVVCVRLTSSDQALVDAAAELIEALRQQPDIQLRHCSPGNSGLVACDTPAPCPGVGQGDKRGLFIVTAAWRPEPTVSGALALRAQILARWPGDAYRDSEPTAMSADAVTTAGAIAGLARLLRGHIVNLAARHDRTEAEGVLLSDTPAARRLIDRASRLSPANAATRHLYAAVLRRAGRLALANRVAFDARLTEAF